MLDSFLLQSMKIVPGIPLASLNAVADANVRDVLKALVDTHHVRNNQTGSGNESFITTRQALALTAAGNIQSTTAPYQLAAYAGGNGDATIHTAGTMGTTAYSLSLNLALPIDVVFHLIWQSILPLDDNCETHLQLFNDGTLILDHSLSCNNAFTQSHYVTTQQTLTAGAHLISAYFGNSYTAGSYTLGRWGILMIPIA